MVKGRREGKEGRERSEGMKKGREEVKKGEEREREGDTRHTNPSLLSAPLVIGSGSTSQEQKACLCCSFAGGLPSTERQSYHY